MADTEHSKRFARKGVRVQVPPSAPNLRPLICGNVVGCLVTTHMPHPILVWRSREGRAIFQIKRPMGGVAGPLQSIHRSRPGCCVMSETDGPSGITAEIFAVEAGRLMPTTLSARAVMDVSASSKEVRQLWRKWSSIAD